MREVLIAIAIFISLSGASLALRYAAWTTLALAGAWAIGLGLLFGIPTAIVYHVRLYRALKPRGALPARWILGPIALHARLTREERRRVVPWSYAGAAGWGVAVLGCVMLTLALIVVRSRGV